MSGAERDTFGRNVSEYSMRRAMSGILADRSGTGRQQAPQWALFHVWIACMSIPTPRSHVPRMNNRTHRALNRLSPPGRLTGWRTLQVALERV
jgi:hypothetical protein